MALEVLRSIIQTPAVHAKPEVARVNPDGRYGAGGKDQRPPRKQPEGTSATTGEIGQTTGKVIDTTA